MTKRRRKRDPIHSPDRSIHVPADRIPQSPVPLPRPVQAYADDVARFWHARLEQGAGNFATAITAYLALPQLRGFWPMSSIDEAENVYDISGQGRTLAPQTNPSFGTEALTPYLLLNGSHYLDRSDEAGLDITGNLTVGCWFYLDTSGTYGLLSKYAGTGDHRTFRLLTVSDVIRFDVSELGTNVLTTVTGATATAGKWYFTAGRYTPGVELAVFLNTSKATNTTSIPSSIHSGTANLQIGAQAGASLLDGRIALPFLCASRLTDATIAHLYQATRTLFAR